MPDLICKINKDELKYQGRNPFVKPKMAEVSGKNSCQIIIFFRAIQTAPGEYHPVFGRTLQHRDHHTHLFVCSFSKVWWRNALRLDKSAIFSVNVQEVTISFHIVYKQYIVARL
jgi:hypothetical protein